MTRILTWNIRHGGGTRVTAILDVLSGHSPDVIVLTEFRNNEPGRSIQEHLRTLGWNHQEASQTEPRKNGVLVASREPASAVANFDDALPEPYRLLDITFSDLRIVGVYMPGNEEKFPYWDSLIERVPALLDASVLYLGDFNTGKHHLDEEGATFFGADRMDRIEKAGFIELWRRQHPEKIEYTWYSPRGNGFRLDHAFASPPLTHRVENTFYSHDERESGVSDHSLMVVELVDN